MQEDRRPQRFRFGVFELDARTGELRRRGLRVRLHAQPLQVLLLLLGRPGEMLTREEISRELWPEGTFVDYEHGVNSAVNRLREALGDKASNPRFVETVARRGYRFVAPVELVAEHSVVGDRFQAATEPVAASPPGTIQVDLPESVVPQERIGFGLLDRVLAAPDDLPPSPPAVVRALFLLLQTMYVGFYVGALANLAEIADLFGALSYGSQATIVLVVTAALLIPVRVFLVCAVLFRAPRFPVQFLQIWPALLALDVVWSLAPFLLLHHLSWGLALACTTVLIYSPFAQRALVLMGAGR